MINIHSESDIETVRQVAILLDRENERLHERIKKLADEIDDLHGTPKGHQVELELRYLKEMLEQRNKALFGRSSEKRQAEESASEASPEKPPVARKGHGPKPQPKLPIVEETCVLDEKDRTCSICGCVMAPMGDQAEESEEISMVKRQFILVKRRRVKYRCKCNEKVVTAPQPPRLIPGGRYSLDFAVEVAAAKYLDHLPLERQVRTMRREGLKIGSQTLWDQIHALQKVLIPTYEALDGYVRSADLIHADETRWMEAERKRKVCRYWVWCAARRDAVFYAILPHRSTEAGRELLKDYSGIVMADGYAVYQALARGEPGFSLANCWAHARRKFVEAKDDYPDEADPFLDLISKLFEVDRDAPAPNLNATESERVAALGLRAELRRNRSRPIIRDILNLAYKTKPEVLPQSSIGKAVAYMMRQWKGLTRFLDDPRIPLDNNHAERSLRGVVLGRKNHYGSRSFPGTQLAALFYSLFESAKLSGIEPKAYVRAAAERALADPGAVTLPRDFPA